jgi:hypothetical protein
MKVIITQMGEPPAIPSAVVDMLTALPGGQSGAPLLPGFINIVNFGAAGTGVGLNAGIARQEVFARCGFDQLVFPPLGSAIEGYGVNVPLTVPNGRNATFTYNPGVSLWRIS